MVTRADGLYPSRRGDRVLLVEPLTASWGVFSQASWRLFASLTRPTPLAEVLARAVAQGLGEEEARALVSQMHRQGFVHLDGRPFLDPHTLWERPTSMPSFVSVHVAEGCNLRCSYCYADAGAELKRMPRELMFRVVEKSIREIPNQVLTIDFLGGEPFLLFDEILEVIVHGRSLADSLGKRVEWIMQTNGTMLTRERARKLRALQVGVGVSIDGPRHLHDRYRPRAGGTGSWEEVFRNLLAAREEGLRVAPLAVIHEPETYTEVLAFFVEHGFDFMRFNYSSVMGRARDELDFPTDRAERFASGFLAMVRWAHQWSSTNGRPLRINDLNQMLHVLVGKSRDYMCMRSPCGLGDDIISFGTAGEIYACEEFERNTKATFLLGQTGEASLPDIIRSSPNYHLLKQRRVEKIPKCSRCHLRYICGGGCTHKTLAYYGTHMREDPMCRYYQVVFEELMWMIADDHRVVENLGIV
jgi:uncharacterized protein